jgi:hypothetical protein
MLIAENVGAYKIAPTKKLKMQIVIEIVDTVIFRGGIVRGVGKMEV